MTRISRKDVAEIIGVVAIVASLVFVGMQLRQAQNIAVAEGYSMLFATRIEVANSVNQDMDIWLKGSAGKDLDEREAATFSILVNQVNESAVQGFLHTSQVAGREQALWNAQYFAAFLYRNSGARAVWKKREDDLGVYRRLLNDDGRADTSWSETVHGFLAELDRLQPNVEKGSLAYW